MHFRVVVQKFYALGIYAFFHPTSLLGRKVCYISPRRPADFCEVLRKLVTNRRSRMYSFLLTVLFSFCGPVQHRTNNYEGYCHANKENSQDFHNELPIIHLHPYVACCLSKFAESDNLSFLTKLLRGLI